MEVTTKYKLVDFKEFKKEYDQLSDVINGYGKDIAKEAGMEYFTLRNAVQGKIKNPAILGGVLQASKIVYNRIICQYSKSDN